MAANSKAPVQVNQAQLFGIAEREMEYRVELFTKISSACFSKCGMKRYKETELYMGETSCVDRCVAKYNQVTNIIGQILSSNRPG